MTQLQTQQSGFINPANYQEAWKFSEMLATSEMIPKNYKNKPADILIAMQMGAELGLKPLQSLQSIAVINGKPSIWGDSLIAICQSSGLLEDITEEVTDDYATVTVKRVGQEPHSVTFTMQDAKKAGLAGKQGPWSQYPTRMMKNRARAFALRDKFADVLSGFGITEEEKDRVLDVTPSRKASAVNNSINALLSQVENSQPPALEYFDTSSLLAEIEQISEPEQIKKAQQKVDDVIATQNLAVTDVEQINNALNGKKFEYLMSCIKACKTMKDVENMQVSIDKRASLFDESSIKLLQDTLNAVAEDMSEAG